MSPPRPMESGKQRPEQQNTCPYINKIKLWIVCIYRAAQTSCGTEQIREALL